jgi:hypothetical protein
LSQQRKRSNGRILVNDFTIALLKGSENCGDYKSPSVLVRDYKSRTALQQGVYQNGKIQGFFRFKSPLGNFQTPENQDIVSNLCSWFDKIEGLLIHPPVNLRICNPLAFDMFSK